MPYDALELVIHADRLNVAIAEATRRGVLEPGVPFTLTKRRGMQAVNVLLKVPATPARRLLAQTWLMEPPSVPLRQGALLFYRG